jgi:hypothetical protein
MARNRLRTIMAGSPKRPAGAVNTDARDQKPRRYGEAGCRWCGGAITGRRRTFCGDPRCVHEFKLRSNATYRRQAVYAHNGPNCQGCGVDTRVIGAALRADPERARREYGLGRARTSRPRRLAGAVFDVEHRVPVAHGGGGCGMDNLVLYCVACHAAATWAVRPRRGKNKADGDAKCPDPATTMPPNGPSSPTGGSSTCTGTQTAGPSGGGPTSTGNCTASASDGGPGED